MPEQAVQIQKIPIKVYRTDDRIMVAAPMAGLEPDDVTVEVGDRTLTIHGDLRGTLSGESDVLIDEWNAGSYHRDLDLPSPVDGSTANVTYSNGVLVVVLPIAEKTTAARLTLDTLTAVHGERVGNVGHPLRPPPGDGA